MPYTISIDIQSVDDNVGNAERYYIVQKLSPSPTPLPDKKIVRAKKIKICLHE